MGSGLWRGFPSSPGRWLEVAAAHRRPFGYRAGGSLPEPHETVMRPPCTSSFPRANEKTEAQGGSRVGEEGSQASPLLGLLDGVRGKVPSYEKTQVPSQRFPWNPLRCLPWAVQKLDLELPTPHPAPKKKKKNQQRKRQGTERKSTAV